MEKQKFEEYDFSGYATKVGKKCTDGRVINKDAFQHNDGDIVPLVWQHLHNEPSNIIGHALLENREDGVYAYCSLNASESAAHVKEAVAHGDITALSIFANALVEKAKNVIHGVIREVSVVISGANPGAFIDNLAFTHGDDDTVTIDSTEAIIYTDEAIVRRVDKTEEVMHADADETDESDDADEIVHADSKTGADDTTLGDIFETLTEDQKVMVYALISQAIEAEAEEESIKQSNITDDEGENTMKKNLFNKEGNKDGEDTLTLTHAQVGAIIGDAVRNGSMREAVLAHAGTFGIDDIDYLFPDAQAATEAPTFVKRNTEWVTKVFDMAHAVPFSRIKSVHADVTPDEARAKGYVKGNEKVDEVFALLKRVTTPTTVYKKQKLDRDDIIDITDLNVVAWLKVEMRMMLEEEIARALLVGDGRNIASDDKIAEANIRPIYTDADLYSVKVPLAVDATTADTIDAIILARKNYKGSGNPSFYSTPDAVGDMLLLKDTTNRRLYNTVADLAAALRVKEIVEVPVMEGVERTVAADDLSLIGIVVNMGDYSIGADKGGAVSMFDDFDIDFNQYKYLIETRISGALTMPHSALVIEQIKPVV